METIETQIPHRPPMRLIARAGNFDGIQAMAEAVICDDNPFVENGVLEPVAFIELIAQAFAACKAVDDSKADTPPKTGYLVGVRECVITGTASVGDVLTVSTRKDVEFDSFTIVNGEVIKGNTLLATASLRVWMEGE